MTNTSTVDVSLVIVNWNTRDVLRGCLRSIYEQPENTCNFEVIVIDNASSDGSAEMVAAEFAKVHVIRNEANRGFAAANNQGMRTARGRYVLLLNADTLVLDNAVAKMVRYADEHPNCAVVGCRVLESDHRVQRTCFRFPSPFNAFLEESGLARAFPRSSLFGRPWMGRWNRDVERDVDVVSGMFMLVRREAIEKVGLMDEDYFVYAEEADWCFRFWRAGWRCRFAPVAEIVHLDGGGRSTSQASIKMFVQLQKSLLIFHRKNLGRWSWFWAKFVFTLSALFRWFFCVVLLVTSPRERHWRKKAQCQAALRFHLLGVYPS